MNNEITIGQKVKKLYPAYASMSDQEVGQRYVAKYGNTDPSKVKPQQQAQNPQQGGNSGQGNPILNSIANAAPGVGGAIGGLAGAVLGTPADIVSGPLGTAIGGVGGAALGGAAGEGVANIIRGISGGKKTDPVQNLKNMAQAGAIQAPFGALGGEGEVGGDIAKAAGIPKFIGEALARFGGGTLAGGTSALAQGQNPGQALKTGEQTGGINTVLPIVTSGIGKAGQALYGQSQKILDKIALDYVGMTSARDPEVLANLDYRDPLASATKLKQAAQQIYQPLTDALSKHTGNFGRFIDTVREGQNQSSLTNEVIDRNVNSMIKVLARKAGGDAGYIAEEINTLENQAGKATATSAPITRIMAGREQEKISGLYSELMDMDLPGNIINEGKMMIDQKISPKAYTNAKNFVESMIGNDAPTAEINKRYNNLTDAAGNISDKYEKARQAVKVGGRMDFIKRILVGGGTGAALGMLGLQTPSAGMMGGTGGIMTVALKAVLDELQSNPTTAVPYSQALNVGETVIPRALQQLGVRLPEMMNGR